MAHQEQMDFVKKTAIRYPNHFSRCRVLEIGSRNINGSVRKLFTSCEYTGLDIHPGPCVDVVSLAHEYKADDLFDTVVSCEAFEHDPHLAETLANIAHLLRPGGLFVATWAGPARPEHGTLRTGNRMWGPHPDYYHGLGPDEFRRLIGDAYRETVIQPRFVGGSSDAEDVYFSGLRT